MTQAPVTSVPRLVRDGDQLFLEAADGNGRKAVRVVWARPVTDRGSEVSFMDKDKKEVLRLASLADLDSASRALAEEDLAKRYLIPRILRILRTEAMFGTQYWQVETDKGERRFALKSDNRNAVWIGPDHLILRDTLGCRYEVNPFSALDLRSRQEAEKVL